MGDYGPRSWFKMGPRPGEEGLAERWRVNRGETIRVVEEKEIHDEGLGFLDELEETVEEEQDTPVEDEGIIDELYSEDK